MKITTKPLPVKYQNLLQRVNVDITQLTYRTSGKSFEAINSTDWSLIINRKNEDTILVCLYSFPLRYVDFMEEYKFIDKTYLKTIQKLSSKYFAKSK